MKRSIFTATILLAAPAFLAAQAGRSLHGTVISGADKLPLAAAAVIERSSGNVVFTDENGFFSIILEGENPRIAVEFLGLQPLEVTVGPADDLIVELPAEPAPKAPRDRKKYTFSY